MSPRVLAIIEMKQHEAGTRVGRGNVLDHGFAAVEVMQFEAGRALDVVTERHVSSVLIVVHEVMARARAIDVVRDHQSAQ